MLRGINVRTRLCEATYCYPLELATKSLTLVSQNQGKSYTELQAA